VVGGAPTDEAGPVIQDTESHSGSYANERIGEGLAGVNLPIPTFILA
jgi:hypothetical protein